MQSFLSPAVSVMSRLSYSKKFFILGLLSFIAVSVVVWMLYQNLNQVIIKSRLELKGLQQVHTLTKAVQKVQQHRGVSAAVLGGVEDFRGQLTIRTQEVNWVLDIIQREFAFEKAPIIADRLNSIKTDWSQIKHQGATLGLETNIALHVKLLQNLVSLKNISIDSTQLALDNERGTYQLIILMTDGLPKVLENMGQIRAYGMVNLVQKSITPDSKMKLMVLKDRVEESTRYLEDDIQQAINYNPMLKSTLELTNANVNNASKLLTENIIPDIVQEKFTISPGYLFNSVTFAQESIYAQIYDSFLPITIKLIEQRIHNAEQIFWLSINIPCGLIALIAYFAMGAHLSVMRNIDKITKISKAFATGDLQQRIAITHDDEMVQVADSFNNMADSFKELLASRELDEIRFQRVIETAPDAVVQMNIHGEITGWNPQAEHIFGWKAHEVMGRLRHEVLIPQRFHETHLRSLQKFADHAEGNKLNLRFELIALHRDGHEFPVELTLTPQIPKSQEFISFIRDISQQKRSLQILKTSEQRYRALFESSRDATLTLNSAWMFVSANSAALSLFGCDNEAQLLELSPVKLSPEYQPNGQLSSELSGYMIAKAMMKGSNSFEWVHQRLNGEYFFAEVNLSKVTFEDDSDIVLLVTIRDISERKIAEKAIVERESRFRNLFNAIPDFIFIMDMEGRFLDVNQSAYEFLGYEREELLAMNAAEIDTPEFTQKIPERLKELQHQDYAFFESAIVKKNG